MDIKHSDFSILQASKSNMATKWLERHLLTKENNHKLKPWKETFKGIDYIFGIYCDNFMIACCCC